MKKAMCFAVVLALAGMAEADPYRYEWRSFGGVNVDLQPLFTWWLIAAATTNQPLDITEVDAAKLAAISNTWEHLPPRPLPNWYRITSEEAGITEVGAMWKVDAVVAPAPMMSKHEVIYLSNPPVKEIQDFKLARAQYMALQNAQSNLAATAEALVSTPAPTNEVTYPGTVTTRDGMVVRRSGTAAVDQNIANNLAAMAAISNNIENVTRLGAAGRYLSLFPSTNVYYLDHFAARTGKQIDGLDVYDLGTAAGLTY